METKSRNSASLTGGILLIGLGLLALITQIFHMDAGQMWPFIVIGVGAMFFVGMAAGGKSTSGLAIPGSIISMIGLMLLYQNLTGHWESWAYGWTVILMAVGVGIYIMGWWGEEPSQRASGMNLFRIGAIMFVIFGAVFEGLLFHSSGPAEYIFPAGLILFGLYLIFRRSGLLAGKKDGGQSDDSSSTM